MQKERLVLQSEDECNQPFEFDRVWLVGKGVGLVQEGGIHAAGTVKVTRYRFRGRKVERYYLYYPSVSVALTSQVLATATGLQEGRLAIWEVTIKQFNLRTPRSISDVDDDLRAKHPVVQQYMAALKVLRRSWVEQVARQKDVAQHGLWHPLSLPWQAVVDLARQVDVVANELAAVQDLVVAAGFSDLTVTPFVEVQVRLLNQLLSINAGLNKIRDPAYGEKARQIRETLRFARCDVERGAWPKVGQLMASARSLAALGLLRMECELVGSLIRLIMLSDSDQKEVWRAADILAGLLSQMAGDAERVSASDWEARAVDNEIAETLRHSAIRISEQAAAQGNQKGLEALRRLLRDLWVAVK